MRGMAPWRALSSVARTPHAILDSLAAARPLKNALKCLDVPAEKTLRWTYEELQAHTKALARGLTELGFVPGDKIAVWAPSTSAEAMVTLLAASRCSLTAVLIDPPTSTEALAPVRVTLDEYSPKALVMWHAFADPVDAMNDLFPDVGIPKSGLASLVANSGTPLKSDRYPSVEYVVHTGSGAVPNALSFKNLMVSSSMGSSKSPPASDKSQPYIVSAVTGETKSQLQMAASAEVLSKKFKLSGDQEAMTGKVVLPTGTPAAAMEALLAAFSVEALAVSPIGSDPSTVAEAEGATLIT